MEYNCQNTSSENITLLKKKKKQTQIQTLRSEYLKKKKNKPNKLFTCKGSKKSRRFLDTW